MQDLWAKLHAANHALPNDLQLQIDKALSVPTSAEDVIFVEWLHAPNGAALGFAGDAVRYVWPDRSPRRSNNFWIRWDALQQRYVLIQRVNSSAPPSVANYRFDDNRVDHMIKCLVLGKRIKISTIRKKHFGIF